MEKLLKLLEQVMPLMTFYPRWAQFLFLTSLTLVTISFLVLVLLYPSVSNKMKEEAPAQKIPPHVQQRIDEDLRQASELFSDLGLSLTDYYAAAVSLRLHLLDYTTAHPEVQSYVSNPLPPGLHSDTASVMQRLGDLRLALSKIQRNRFALACWKRAAKDHQATALMDIGDHLIRHGFSASEASIAIDDIANLAQFFTIAANKLGNETFAPLLTAVLATNSADIDGVGLAYDHAALRSLVFSGNLIFPFVEQSRVDDKRNFVASWGTAILLDIYRGLPDADILKAELKARHPEHAEAIARLGFTLEPEELISKDLLFAIEELERRRSLLFFELPPPGAN